MSDYENIANTCENELNSAVNYTDESSSAIDSAASSLSEMETSLVELRDACEEMETERDALQEQVNSDELKNTLVENERLKKQLDFEFLKRARFIRAANNFGIEAERIAREVMPSNDNDNAEMPTG